uniref:Transcriptional regulator, GntR family n=1 Tax=Nonomuraea gerenzanensis TaxID=93944 RepID=A0A1M4E4M8_9ACTN|nr:Transcriptional regulator, GntR family [Nonomuraea gerenzanensis]
MADHLREAILSGAIAPGERIRQEEPAERLGASRLPVREALRMLEAEGLTEHHPRREGVHGCPSWACTRWR